MNSLKHVKISEVLSPDLALRDTADNFFAELAELKSKEIAIDFSNVKSITRSFAHEYQENKKLIKKKVIEVNVPQSVKKMFAVVFETQKKNQIINLKNAEVITV